MTVVNPHAKVTLARHETFHLRDGWMAKALFRLKKDPMSLTTVGAHHELGVGKNMLTSIRYWVAASGLAFPRSQEGGRGTEYHLSPLGRLLLDRDPYFEDERTLWLWHMAVASNREGATFWYWLFNEYNGFEFGENDAAEEFSRYVVGLGHKAPNLHSIKKDFSCLLRTYLLGRSARAVTDETASPISSLHLLQEQPLGNRYRFNLDRERLPDPLVVAYALQQFVESERSGYTAVSIEELRWAPKSPGRLLCLDTRALMTSLESLQRNEGWVEMTHTAGLSIAQIQPLDSQLILARMYER